MLRSIFWRKYELLSISNGNRRMLNTTLIFSIYRKFLLHFLVRKMHWGLGACCHVWVVILIRAYVTSWCVVATVRNFILHLKYCVYFDWHFLLFFFLHFKFFIVRPPFVQCFYRPLYLYFILFIYQADLEKFW